MTLSVTRLFPSGAWEVSAIIGNVWFRRTYYGYTKRQAVRAFRRECVT